MRRQKLYMSMGNRRLLSHTPQRINADLLPAEAEGICFDERPRPAARLALLRRFELAASTQYHREISQTGGSTRQAQRELYRCARV